MQKNKDDKSTKPKLASVVELFPKKDYEVFNFSWGAGIKDLRNGQWSTICFPDGQELNVEEWDVELSDDGIKIFDYYLFSSAHRRPFKFCDPHDCHYIRETFAEATPLQVESADKKLKERTEKEDDCPF